MTPEQYQQFQGMQRTIAELKTTVDSLTMSSKIPLNIEDSFRDRLKPVSSEGKQGAFGTQSINISGDPQTINVPAQPSGTLKVEDLDGNQYELLIK